MNQYKTYKSLVKETETTMDLILPRITKVFETYGPIMESDLKEDLTDAVIPLVELSEIIKGKTQKIEKTALKTKKKAKEIAKHIELFNRGVSLRYIMRVTGISEDKLRRDIQDYRRTTKKYKRVKDQ